MDTLYYDSACARTAFLQQPPPAVPLLPWSTPDCRSARRGSSPAYPAKIMRLIVSRLQSANSTASYRNRGAAVQLYPHANSLDSISRNGRIFGYHLITSSAILSSH